jgi:hypothetical protein
MLCLIVLQMMRRRGCENKLVNALHDLLSQVFWGQIGLMMALLDVATGRVEIDTCMTRWRDFYHRLSRRVNRTVYVDWAVDPRTAEWSD